MYQTPDMSLWKGRVDSRENRACFRWHQAIELISLEGQGAQHGFAAPTLAFLGFASDEGVRRNRGREGAYQGCYALRHALANLAVHFEEDQLHLVDAGTVLGDRNLHQAQRQFGEKVTALLQRQWLPVLMGGGHEISYGHFMGLESWLHQSGKRFGILNFDAHWDLRNDPPDGIGSSGTPFRQIAERCQELHIPFHYLVAGIQESANTRWLFDKAESLGATSIPARKFSMAHRQEVLDQLQGFLEKVDCVMMTVDLDGFAAAYAPGVSAPNATGFLPDVVMECFETVMAHQKLLSFDMAELNPRYDLDGRTARLAAALIYELSRLYRQYPCQVLNA